MEFEINRHFFRRIDPSGAIPDLSAVAEDDARVGEIGERVGWSDPKRFAENFRRHFGMKASEYRRRMLGRDRC
ncbi:helix-turn-helix domain-containing protein [Puniceicoccus vermicola]|uniref:Helix-turn-helix domain-containing protein n=1 Tax=Puniceicoccus vermicola TaxID=388746 RepID=A0A7X1AXB5_9BACT|nr:helix-turn-helix domain-containing protein [Puniceicoccus vermicola]